MMWRPESPSTQLLHSYAATHHSLIAVLYPIISPLNRPAATGNPTA